MGEVKELTDKLLEEDKSKQSREVEAGFHKTDSVKNSPDPLFKNLQIRGLGSAGQ